jgi:hypothetical protein
MIFCPRCNKNVDFNSVSVAGATCAYTFDLNGPVDPTIIQSSSRIVNICKHCGYDNLFLTKKDYLLKQQKAVVRARNKIIALKALGFLSLISGIILGFYMRRYEINSDPDITPNPEGVKCFLYGFGMGFVCMFGMGFCAISAFFKRD